MDLIVNNGVSAISLPADEVGMLVQSASWSGRTDVVEYLAFKVYPFIPG